MASKPVKKLQQQQQRNKQPCVASKVVTIPLQGRSSSDPWSFLELIDAPQWRDLTLVGSSMEKDGFDDPWFDRSHKHHVKSFAGLNANMSWLRLGKSGQGTKTIFPTRYQRAPSKPEKNQSAGHQNKLGNKQTQSLCPAIGSRVHKEEQDLYNTESFSGCSSTSVKKPSGFFKKRSLCSDRSSVSSSLQVCSVELKNSSLKAHRGSLNANLSEDFHDAHSSLSSGTQKSRNSSSASYCPPMGQYSSEVGVSTCITSSEFGVSRVAKLQFACEADRQSSGDSVVTSESVTSRNSKGQAGEGCSRAWEEGINCTRETSELKVDGGCNQTATGADSSTFNKNLLCCQRMANGAVKRGIKAGKQRLETRVSLVRSLPRKQLYIGKENAPPEGNSVAANLLRVESGHLCTKAPLAFASSKTANARTVGLTLGGRFHASQVSKVEGTQHALPVKPWKGGISQNLYRSCASSTAHQRKRSESNQLPVLYEKTSNSERELAALLAQHNQKIWSLQLQNCRKGLR